MTSFLPNDDDKFNTEDGTTAIAGTLSIPSPSVVTMPAPSGTWGSVRSHRKFSRLSPSAKAYWEALILDPSPGTNAFKVRVGFAPSSWIGFAIGDSADTSARRVDLYTRNSQTVFDVADIADNEVALFALDLSTLKLWLGDVQNTAYATRVWSNSGDPTAGTGNVDTLPSANVHMAVSMVDEPGRYLICTGRNYLIYPAPSGFTPLDSIDTETDVTWDAALKDATITLSNGNKTAAGTTAGRCALATRIITEKAHFEVLVSALGTGAADTLPMVGLGTCIKAAFLNSGLAAGDLGYRSDGAIRSSGSTVATVSSYTTNDVIGVEFDPETGEVWVFKNGTVQNSGNPVATINTAFYWIPAIVTGANGTMVGRFESADFTTTPTTGFNPVRLGDLEGAIYIDPDSAVQGGSGIRSPVYPAPRSYVRSAIRV